MLDPLAVSAHENSYLVKFTSHKTIGARGNYEGLTSSRASTSVSPGVVVVSPGEYSLFVSCVCASLA